MPIKSPEQWGMMQASKHGNIRGIVPKPVATKFVEETPKKKRSLFARALRKKQDVTSPMK